MINLSCKWCFNLNKAAVCRFSFVNVGKFLIRIRKEHLFDLFFSCSSSNQKPVLLIFTVVLLFDSTRRNASSHTNQLLQVEAFHALLQPYELNT